MTYFVRSERPATPAKMYQASVFQGSSGGVPTTRRIRATPLPVSIALAGHTNERRLAERQDDLDDRAGQDRREDLRHADLEVQPDLAEDVDRDDHCGDVQPRVADARQDQRVRCCRRT